MIFTLLVNHAKRLLSQLRGILCLSVHGSIFSKLGASVKPWVIHPNNPMANALKIFLFAFQPRPKRGLPQRS